MPLLTQDFYSQDTKKVAKLLLGKILCRREAEGHVTKSRIVETEAYLGLKDPAAHTFGDRRTQRTKAMYLDGGHAYIYMIYGMYFCLNVVTRTTEHPEAVLLRAVEPLDFVMPRKKPSKTQLPANGPGKICRYLELTKNEDGLSLMTKKSVLWIENAEDLPSKEIVTAKRIGVDYAGDAANWPLRFYIRDNLHVSKK